MVGKRAWTCAKERIPRAFAWQLFQCIIARAAHIVTESRRVSYVSRSWGIDRWIRSARVDRIRTADHGNEEEASWIEGKGRKKKKKREGRKEGRKSLSGGSGSVTKLEGNKGRDRWIDHLRGDEEITVAKPDRWARSFACESATNRCLRSMKARKSREKSKSINHTGRL